MGLRYNLVAGKNLERIAAISDGLFAVAMTLLVLDLHVPASEAVRSEADLWNALAALRPRFVPYFMCFLTLGIFWVGRQAQLNVLERADRNFTWLQIAFLLIVSLLPFTTALLATFITFRLALIVYRLNVVFLGALLFATWRYAQHANLIKPDVPRKLTLAIERRIVVRTSALCVRSRIVRRQRLLSIAFIVLLQLNYAIAPKLPLLRRL